MLCETGRFQSNLGVDAGGACVALFRNETTGPTSDFGAFRVQIEEIHFNRRYRKLHLGRDQPSPHILQDKDSSFIELRVMVEPRMMFRNDGAEGTKRHRRPWAIPSVGRHGNAGTRHSDFGLTTGACDVRQVPLKQVEQPAG